MMYLLAHIVSMATNVRAARPSCAPTARLIARAQAVSEREMQERERLDSKFDDIPQIDQLVRIIRAFELELPQSFWIPISIAAILRL